MFPGQSSRYPEMLEKLVEAGAANRAIIARASDVVGRDLADAYRPDKPGLFQNNLDVQIAVFLANYIHAAMLRARGIEGDLSLGLSLGEYNHLVDIGALSFEDALRLIAIRGALYDAGPPGAMAAVGPIDSELLEGAMAEAQQVGPVELAVENSPAHHVVGGSGEAIGALLDRLDREHFVSGTIIENRIAMHTSLFAGVAGRFRPHLEAAAWRRPQRAYWPNVTAEPIAEAMPADFVECLSRHVHHRVKWRQSIEAIVKRWPDAVFVEAGPRGVLCNLMNRRWIPNRKFRSDGDGAGELEIDAVCEALAPDGSA